MNSLYHGHKMVSFLKRINVRTCVKILKTVVPDTQDTTTLHELGLGNKADCYEKALKPLHSFPMALIQKVWRPEERLHWLSL